MTAKELILKDKDLSDQWRAVTHATWFDRIRVFAWAQWQTDGNPTREEMTGAKAFERVLLGLCEEEVEVPDLPNMGLEHNIDEPRAEKDLIAAAKKD